MTFAQDLEQAAAPDIIETVLIEGFGWGGCEDGPQNDGDPEDGLSYKETPEMHEACQFRGIPTSWEVIRPFLDYEYDDGFGAPECHTLQAWTPNKILYIHEYDGSTTVCYVQRNPIAP